MKTVQVTIQQRERPLSLILSNISEYGCRVAHVLNRPVSSAVAIAVLYLWIANILDFFLTVENLTLGAREANPLLASFFHSGQLIQAFLVKNGMTFIGLTILAILARTRPVTTWILFSLCSGYTALIFYHLSNIL